MDNFTINCPCCGENSNFYVEIDKLFISKERVIDDLEEVFHVDSKTERIFHCKNKLCWAPFEAVICNDRHTAILIQKEVQKIAWFTPRRFRLRKNENNELYDNYFGILFNRQPLKRWKDFYLSSLVDINLIEKFLLASFVLQRYHPSYFEAWPVNNEIYWLPMDPLITSNIRKEITERNPLCKKCREFFLQKENDILRQRLKTHKDCIYEENCPANNKCILENSDLDFRDMNRCLLRLEIRRKISPCYNSDLHIIEKVTEKFLSGKLDIDKPIIKECWTGNLEIAIPIIVHNHLVAVVITGPFISEKSAKSLDELIKMEYKWRFKNDMPLESICQQNANSFIDLSLDKRKVASYDEIKETFRDLRIDTDQITKVAENRYLQHRKLLESTFRQELDGKLTNHFLSGKNFSEFLQDILSRMKTFWGFDSAYLLMGMEWDDELTLFSSDMEYLEKGMNSVKIPFHSDDELGTRSVFFPRLGPLSGELKRWQTFFSHFKDKVNTATHYNHNEVFITLIHTGPRYYVFIMCGREIKNMSCLPYYDKMFDNESQKVLRLSEICQEEISRTCQNITKNLHNFWYSMDQEQLSRVISHSLRNPIMLMSEGRGRLYQKLLKYQKELQQKFPDFYDVSSNLLKSLRIGSKLVDDELQKLTAAANLEDLLNHADKGSTDLVLVLKQLTQQFKFMSQTARKTWRTIYWDLNFESQNEARVHGSEDSIRLAIRNVLDNAYKYSYNKRTIFVKLYREKNNWIVTVKSQGVTLKEEEFDRIWDKNYRGIDARKRISKAAEGTGYGLYLVKRILEKTQGENPKPYSISAKSLDQVDRPEGIVEVKLFFKKKE